MKNDKRDNRNNIAQSPYKRIKIWIPLLTTFAISCAGVWYIVNSHHSSEKETQSPHRSPLSSNDMPKIANFINDTWTGAKPDTTSLPKRLLDPNQGVYVAFRHKGLRHYETWEFNGTVADALKTALAKGHKNSIEQNKPIDVLEINIAHSFRKINYQKNFKRLVSNVHRGVRGIRIKLDNKENITAPTQFLAKNRKLDKHINLVLRDWYATKKDMNRAVYEIFQADQILITLEPTATATLIERGNTYVPIEAVIKESTEQLVKLQAIWMVNNIHDDGRMTYIYWPSTGKEAPADKNNMIRQWMATAALSRLAAFSNDQTIWNIQEKNIDYNLKKFYRIENGLGIIEWNGKVKLGALSLAAYAIMQHPKQEKWAEQVSSINKTINSLWNEDGSFTNFYRKPPGTREQNNFYPGEALFFWAELYEQTRDPELLRKFMKSFKYYRAWHLKPKNRNPAFIPWHTQAYYQVWKITKDEELRDFIFKMNDWLLKIQQWDSVLYRDTKGRFYSTGHWYGPPHASATGVYMEGLIDAYKLAVELGDTKRQNAYRLSLVRGLRSIMQLQFVDNTDTFYISKKDNVIGGLRTTVYNNAIRCDNVQHSMMANIKILETFSAEDYSHP